MELIKAIAIALHEEAQFGGKWPDPATEVTQQSTYCIEFDAPVYRYTSYTGAEHIYSEMDDVSGLPFMEEYDDGETITKEEYVAYMEANPNFYADMIARRPFLIQEIARLNALVASTIDEMTALAEEAGVEVTINLGQHGSLDPNSDWDSSRC